MSIEELPIPDEFWTNKIIDENGCWIWQGRTTPTGYGILNAFGSQVRVYRLSLILSTKQDPRGMHACHKPNICFSKACYNPEHLYWGTAAENGRDKRGMQYETSEVCTRGHDKSKFHDKYSRCLVCTLLLAIAKKGGIVSKTHAKKLKLYDIDINTVDLNEYGLVEYKEPTCKRGHSKAEYQKSYGSCSACKALRYVAKLEMITPYHEMRLKDMGLDLSQINLDDYR